ncbi:Protein of unknown function [Klenkia soli]|uniref:DUF2510 domain-containing protein n=1 Tax=Klenkia soli TaxID=1052260 RepID=A0A1H0JJH9_9ACTN|nr:phospholipid scramblase-related protein [Klenkia soli]SDO43866.1 Protein of unknown function [Klenkia soli]
MSSPPPPPGWYPDPAGTPASRWWDGQNWTDHLQQPQQAPPPQQQYAAQPQYAPQQPQYAPQQQYTPHQQGRSVLLEQAVLVVQQKAKLIELTNEYAVFDGGGQQLGAVVEVGQSAAKKALRFVSSIDQFLTHKLEVRDATGVVLVLTRPAKLVKSRVQVARASGEPVGEIVQANVFGKIRFDLVVGGQLVGAIQAENWRAWNFAVTDHTGQEIARITKTWEGLAKTLFTTADNYAVQVHRRLEEPLASLVLASALTVDTALKQDDRGFG